MLSGLTLPALMSLALVGALLAQAPAAAVELREAITRPDAGAQLAQASAAGARPSIAAANPDACALLADADVRAVLGVAVSERRPGTQQARGLLLSQCYLGTGTPRSVSIAVAGDTTSGGKTVTPRAFWREQFHRGEKSASERRQEEHASRQGDEKRASARSDQRGQDRNGNEREEEVETKAKAIGGVGEEAFWSGTRVAGALYVLRGHTFIRVSVGGIADEQERIEKSRQLAKAALARLR